MALDYFPEFQCLTTKCTYTCCYQWKIIIDRPDYIKLKNLKTDNKEIKYLAENLCKRNRSKNTTYFAEFVLQEDGYCPLLSEQKMCRLQQECGYQILPRVCKVFPRIAHLGPGYYEECCSTGCEAVSYLLLDRPQGLRVIEWTQSTTPKVMIETVLKEKLEKTPQMNYYKEVQMLTLGILQNRKYTVQDRLLLLGMAMKRLEQAKTAPDTLNWIRDSLPLLQYDENIQKSLNTLQKNRNIGIFTAIQQIYQHNINVGKPGSEDLFSKEVLERVYKNLELTKEPNQEDEARITMSINHDAYESALHHFENLPYTEYFFENLMVNLLYQLQFPLLWRESEQTIWQRYMEICIQYNMFRVITVAYMKNCEEKDELVRAITVVSRLLLHNETLRQVLVKDFEKNGTDNLASLAYLIRC